MLTSIVVLLVAAAVGSSELGASERLDAFDRAWAGGGRDARLEALKTLIPPADAAEVERLLSLLVSAPLDRAPVDVQRAAQRREYDRATGGIDALDKILRNGYNLTEDQQERRDRLVRRLKPIRRRLTALDQRLATADVLRRAIVAALSAVRAPAAWTALQTASGDDRAAVAGAAIEALAESGRADAAASVRAQIAHADPAVAVLAIGATAALADAEAVSALQRALARGPWQIEAAAAAALGRLRARAAIGTLVERLAAARGRLREDLAAALQAITGFELGREPDAWTRWWKASKDRLDEVLARRQAAVAATARKGRTVSFYGVQTLSTRICFVIDTSASMREKTGSRGWNKLQVAQRELRLALQSLPREARFNIVHFNDRVRIRHEGGLIEARSRDVRATINWVRDRLRPVGGTNLYDGLDRAFGLARAPGSPEAGIDTVYVLTDGQPSTGQLTTAAQILEVVRMRNRVHRLRLHVIGVGDAVDRSFLQRLAADSGGRFVHRDR